MTRGDRIRAMTDEALVDLLYDSVDFFSCDECAREEKPSDYCCADCKDYILRYLEEDAE